MPRDTPAFGVFRGRSSCNRYCPNYWKDGDTAEYRPAGRVTPDGAMVFKLEPKTMPDAIRESAGTRTILSDRASLWISWKREENGEGWNGLCSVYRKLEPNDPYPRRGDDLVCTCHSITLFNSSPLGSLVIDVDPYERGARSHRVIPASGISHHDLQWATIFASEVLAHTTKLAAGECEKCEGKRGIS